MTRPPEPGRTARLTRLGETDRPTVAFTLDGQPAQALAGDTVLTAMLTQGRSLRASEFGGERRAGFCLMGACQDCWVWTANGDRLRACSTPITDGMALMTHAPEPAWLPRAS